MQRGPVLLLIVGLGLAGCSREQVHGAIYEGLRTREEIVHPPDQRGVVRDRPLTYGQYETQRQRALDEAGTR